MLLVEKHACPINKQVAKKPLRMFWPFRFNFWFLFASILHILLLYKIQMYLWSFLLVHKYKGGQIWHIGAESFESIYLPTYVLYEYKKHRIFLKNNINSENFWLNPKIFLKYSEKLKKHFDLNVGQNYYFLGDTKNVTSKKDSFSVCCDNL